MVRAGNAVLCTVCGLMGVSASAESLFLRESWPPDGAARVPVDSRLALRFSAPPDLESARAGGIRLVRSDTGAEVSLRISAEEDWLVLVPVVRFVAPRKYPLSEEVIWTGLKPDTHFQVLLRDTLKDREGNSLAEPAAVAFSTAHIEWGVHWLSEDAEMEKHHKGISPRFYLPDRPTVLYVHGWQSGTSVADFKRENPFFYNSKYFGFYNAIPDWKAKNFNVGILFWSQWADEPEVRDAEAKIWTGKGSVDKEGKSVDMRYRVRNGSFETLSTSSSVSDFALEDYLNAMGDYRGPSVRMVGHSLGNQLATTLTKRLSDKAKAGEISWGLVPTRLTLLDPFWGKGKRDFLQGRTTGEVCAKIVGELATDGLAIDVYKTSPLGGIIGDENLPLRRHVAFGRLWPDFVSLLDFMYQHVFGYIWFAQSITTPVPAGQGHLGSGADDADIRALMNSRDKPLKLWYSDGPGTRTSHPADDVFYSQDGVSTW